MVIAGCRIPGRGYKIMKYIPNTSGKNKIIYLENRAKENYIIPVQLDLLLTEAVDKVGLEETIEYIEESLGVKLKVKK